MTDQRIGPPTLLEQLSDTRMLPRDCGEFGLRIGRDGAWYYLNSPIERRALVKLFASVLKREGDQYWLVTPAERGTVTVEDAPFITIALSVSGTGRHQSLRFTTNLDEHVTADHAHPIRVEHAKNGEPRPYILIRDGLEALITRAIYYDLSDIVEPNSDGGQERLGVWSAGTFFPLD